jgi:hypothetical protein
MNVSDNNSACCVMIALKLADNWEEDRGNLLEGIQLIPDGKVHYRINHVPEIEVLIELKSGKSYNLKTPPIAFINKEHQFLFFVQYDDQKEMGL